MHISWISSVLENLLLRCPSLGMTMRMLPLGRDGGPGELWWQCGREATTTGRQGAVGTVWLGGAAL